MIKNIKTKEELNELVKNNEKVFVDFYADWCGPCIMMGPTIDELAKEDKNFVVAKVNIEEATELANEHAIVSIPTMKLYVDGKEEKTTVGFMPKNKIIEFCND